MSEQNFGKVAALSLGLTAAMTLGGCDSSDLAGSDEPSVLPSTKTEIAASLGGTAVSHDTSFAIEFDAGVFDRDVTVTVIEGVRAAAAAVTIGKLYEIQVTPAGSLAAGFSATLTFDAATVPQNVAISDLVVAAGEAVGEAPMELLPITHDAMSNEITATTSHLSWFGLMDENGFVACSCDVSSGCDDGCEFCDDDCAASGAGQYPYPTCISSSGCESDERCLDGWCAGVCDTAGDCATGLTCRDGWCVATCGHDSDCNGNFGADCCFQGVCVVADYCGVTSSGEECSLYFGEADGCDCGCGGIDPDCGTGGCSFPGCADAACEQCWTVNGESTTCVQAQ